MSVSSCLCGCSVRINEELRSGQASWLKLPGPLQGQGKGPQAVMAFSRPFPDVSSLIIRNILTGTSTGGRWCEAVLWGQLSHSYLDVEAAFHRDRQSRSRKRCGLVLLHFLNCAISIEFYFRES